MPAVSALEVAVTPGGAEGLSRADCLCPVCLEIFLEPVTLPCTHTFCKPCFLDSVDKATMLCPLCRKRVSTWARHNSRKKTLVNNELWRRVQAAFPMQCQRRLSGQEEEDEEGYEDESFPKPRVCQPGELRREYEDQISKLAEERRALEEAEKRASEEYIQHLLTEEEEQQQEEEKRRRRQEDSQLEEDEKLAKMLSGQLNPSPSPISESQRKAQPNDIITPAKKKPNPITGDIEKYFSPVPRRLSTTDNSPSSSSVANDTTSHPAAPSHASPTSGLGLGKRKSWEVDCDGGETVSKRSCPTVSPLESPPLSREGTSDPPEKPLLLHELAQWEERLFGRRQQEEEDRKMALALQKQLDREETRRRVDRTKGSGDTYLFRRKPRAEQAAPSRAPNRRWSHPSTTTSKQEKNSVEERRPSAPTPRPPEEGSP